MATKPILSLHRMAKDIQMWLVDKLIPRARNPRTHSDAQVAQIAASIAEFGFNNPILVDTKSGIIAATVACLPRASWASPKFRSSFSIT